MAGQAKTAQFWNVCYPVFVYFAVTFLAVSVWKMILWQTEDATLLCQLFSSAAALPFLYAIYRGDNIRRGTSGEGRYLKKPRTFAFSSAAALFVLGAGFSIILNNFMGFIRITDYSASYAKAEQMFYTGQLLLELFSLGIVIPVVEELLYRGIVYGRMRDWHGVRFAAVASALLFGIIHMNLAQFAYASIFGLLLAYYAQKAESVWGAIFLHMAANLTSVLRAETGLFAIFERETWGFAILTALSAAACAAGAYFFRNGKRN